MIAQAGFRSHANAVVGNNYNYTIKADYKSKLAALAQENDISKAVKLYRQHAGITQQQLAALVGCSTHQITRIECGALNEIRSNRYLIAVRNIIKEQTGVELDIGAHIAYSAQPNSKTGIRGVCFSTERSQYIATLRLKGEHFFLGYFSTLEEAAHVRRRAEEKAAEGIDALRAWTIQLKLTRRLKPNRSS